MKSTDKKYKIASLSESDIKDFLSRIGEIKEENTTQSIFKIPTKFRKENTFPPVNFRLNSPHLTFISEFCVHSFVDEGHKWRRCLNCGKIVPYFPPF